MFMLLSYPSGEGGRGGERWREVRHQIEEVVKHVGVGDAGVAFPDPWECGGHWWVES